ncbi:MAG: N-acetyltransferase [Burkholderiales bacterium]
MSPRPASPLDDPAIDRVVERAFRGHPRSDGTEVAIVRGLRDAGALSVSLVAAIGGEVRGYVAASPVRIAGATGGWHGLGPLAVDPASQRIGLGSALVAECLSALCRLGADGCVVLGDPAYYRRFGFRPIEELVYSGASPAHFLAHPFRAVVPRGEVAYHDAFAAPARNRRPVPPGGSTTRR